ncbi:hypothetical protein IWZ00DRAFT_548575 [Phyllosticta capitalensis]|uniref:uncharacterized protein n=1 Tax=Phyllosticta capitalensis TaxID=121624 RepID=UPI00312FAA3F
MSNTGVAEQDASEDHEDFVTLMVGAHYELFRVKLSLLSNASLFFKKAFESGFIEGKERFMVLEDTDVEVFRLILDFLENGRSADIFKLAFSDDLYSNHNQNGEVEWDLQMSSIYVFAMMYLVDELAVGVAHMFTERFEEYKNHELARFPTATTVTRVFDNVPDDAPLCEMFVEAFVDSILSGRLDILEPAHIDEINQFPADFIAAVEASLSARRSGLGDELLNNIRTTARLSQITALMDEQTSQRGNVDYLRNGYPASMRATIVDLTVEIEKLKKENEELRKGR